MNNKNKDKDNKYDVVTNEYYEKNKIVEDFLSNLESLLEEFNTDNIEEIISDEPEEKMNNKTEELSKSFDNEVQKNDFESVILKKINEDPDIYETADCEKNDEIKNKRTELVPDKIEDIIVTDPKEEIITPKYFNNIPLIISISLNILLGIILMIMLFY